MLTYADIQHYLDQTVGPGQFGAHRAFWRGMTRSQFVEKAVYGYSLIVLHDGAGSNLVKALRGEAPFGDDIGTPGGLMPRMPARRPPMAEHNIQAISLWIDGGCPE